MLLIIIILIKEIIGRVATTYPTAPELTLVDIAVVDVVVPLDDVQMSCSADHHASRRRQEVEEVVDRSSSCVEDALQKPDCRSSPEQMNSRTMPVSEACSPYYRAHRNQDGDDGEQLNSELVKCGCVSCARGQEKSTALCILVGTRRDRCSD